MHLALTGAIQGLLAAGVYAVMASGLTLVFGVMHVINIAHAAFVVLGGYLTYTLWNELGLDPFLAILPILPAMFVVGVLVERLFLSRVKRNRLLMTMLVTFAIAVVIEGVLNVVYTSDLIQVTTSYVTATFDVGGIYIAQVYAYAFLLSAVLLGLLYVLLYRTTFGRSIRAVVDNPLGARLIGIDLERVNAISFGLGTALAAAGGAVYAMTSSVHGASWHGLIPTLLAIVILGGLGSIRGALVGSVAILVVEGTASVTWSPVWSKMITYGLLAAFLLLRPRGLLGTRELRAQ
jgi:branched-chain amino acid transport system permease protein